MGCSCVPWDMVIVASRKCCIMKSTSKRLQIKCVTTRESGEVTFGGVKICGGGR